MNSEPSTAALPTPEETTAQRQLEYGDWKNDGNLADELIRICERSQRWNDMPGFVRQSIRMILVKIARLCTGNYGNRDSWHDIQGYALIAEERVNAKVGARPVA